MIKKSLIILTALFMIACGKTQQNQPVVSERIQANNGVLIIFYDKSETSVKQLLAQGKKWNVELLYDYKSINGLAIRAASKNNIEKIKNFYKQYKQMKGVLSVEDDQINQLDSLKKSGQF